MNYRVLKTRQIQDHLMQTLYFTDVEIEAYEY